MSPVVRGPFGRFTAGLRLVSRNPGHFRTARWFLLAEGAVLIALGLIGFISATAHPDAGPTGAPALGLELTRWHSAILLTLGVLAVVGTLRRRAALIVTALSAVGFVVLMFVGAVAAVHQAPGPLGFNSRDIVLHGVLAAVNFAMLYWLLPDALEGPDWVPRQHTETKPILRSAERTEPRVVPGARGVTTAADPPATAVSRADSPTTSPAGDSQNHSRATRSSREEFTMRAPQNVVITGASAGIGRATARAFAARGDNIALLARGRGGLDATVKDVEAAGGKAMPIPVDVSEYDQVDAAATKFEEAFGPIDVWVNVAFTSVFAPFHEIKPQEYRRVTEVSYLGYVHGTMVALSRMRPRNAGTIVQVGSALGSRSIPLQSAYCGAKHAINGFTESVRTELLHEHSGVHITVAQMPAVNTPQFAWVLSRLPKHPQPVPPIYQPEVAARAVVYAAEHPRRKQYWVGASTAATTLGQRLAPALLDRYLAKTGYASQQTGESVSADRPNNLWEPLDGGAGEDYGAHGEFDKRAHNWSPQLWVSEHLGLASVTAAGAGGVALAGTLIRRRT